MSPRAKIIGAQTAAVVALVVVVYAVLLRPEGTNEISGIEAPQGGPPPARVEARGDGRSERGERRERERHERERRNGRQAPEAASPVGGGVTAAATPPPSAGVAGAAPAGPPDYQYADAAKLLLKRVRGGGMPGE